jgi:uncharacterized protein (DUF1697 family)
LPEVPDRDERAEGAHLPQAAEVAVSEVFQGPDATAERYAAMTVYIALLRGINVGGNNLIKMDALRTLCGKLKLCDVATYVQSGNVVFRAAEDNAVKVGRLIEDGIQRTFGIRAAVVIRTAAEFREAAARNPFAGRSEIEPGKLLVTFLAMPLGKEAREKVLALRTAPEELHLEAREMFVYFPNGQAKSTLPMAKVDRALGTTGTGRNWNTVVKLLAMAEDLEAL